MLILVFVFMLFNLTRIRAVFTLVFVSMLFNLTSIRAMLILIYKIVMIYVLILIWKLSTFSTAKLFEGLGETLTLSNLFYLYPLPIPRHKH